MSALKNSHLPQKLFDYAVQVGVREPEVLGRLRRETAAMPSAAMQISPDQGQFMALLVKLLEMRKILEIGVFTGYSSLVMALALPAGGRITALDVSREWTAVARRYWQEAGVTERIDLRLAPALDSLEALLAGSAGGSYDFAFIDADKEHYPHYYEASLELVRPGGLIGIDNAFHMGRVAEPDRATAETAIIDRLNRQIYQDERVDISLTSIGDGLMLCRKRP